MKLARGAVLASFMAIAIVLPGCAVHPKKSQKTLVGQFSYLDTSRPGCGIFVFTSKATFVVDDTGKKIKLAVPCVEIDRVDDGLGQKGPVRIGERYKIVLDRVSTFDDARSPYFLNRRTWYLTDVSK